LLKTHNVYDPPGFRTTIPEPTGDEACAAAASANASVANDQATAALIRPPRVSQ
jgi:hypothetical protein